MKKRHITSALILCFILPVTFVNANMPGKLKGKITTSGDTGMLISLNANGGTSSSGGVSNAFSFNPNLGLELFWGGFGLGLDAGTFNTLPDFDFDKYAVPLKSLDFITIANARNHWTSSYLLVGPSFTFGRKHIGNVKYENIGRHTPFHNKLELTLSVKGGVSFNNAPDFLIVDNLTTPAKNIASYSAPADTRSTFLSLKPNVTFSYFMTTNFAVNANVQYLMQANAADFATGYRDYSRVNFGLAGKEVEAQLSQSPKVITTTKGPDTYLSFGIGLSYYFRKGWDGTVKGGSKGRTYTGGRRTESSPEVMEEKGIQENGLAKNENNNTVEKRKLWGIGGNVNFDNAKINNINNGMPNRISMNVTVPKQTQGATFGEKVNAGKINITLVEGGCIVLFPDNAGYRVNTSKNTIKPLSKSERREFGEKVNQRLHAAGGTLAQGASLLGGALPGGSVISAAVSSVSNLAGGSGGGAAAASYAATGRMTNPDTGKTTWKINDADLEPVLDLPDGDYVLEFMIAEKAKSGQKDTLKTQVFISFSKIGNVLKTKHDTAKNSVGNIR
ncbi:MAG: hypothetical protein PHT07_01915 [Paludibacter sp.]|nr:hypothetical protein [Paludibacter sp.]